MLEEGYFIDRETLLKKYGWEDLEAKNIKVDSSDILGLDGKGLYCIDEPASIGDMFVIKDNGNVKPFQEEASIVADDVVFPVVTITSDGKLFTGSSLGMPAGKKKIEFKGVQVVDKKEYKEYRERIELIGKALSQMPLV